MVPKPQGPETLNGALDWPVVQVTRPGCGVAVNPKPRASPTDARRAILTTLFALLYERIAAHPVFFFFSPPPPPALSTPIPLSPPSDVLTPWEDRTGPHVGSDATLLGFRVRVEGERLRRMSQP